LIRGHLGSYYNPRPQYAVYLALGRREVWAGWESVRVANASKPRRIVCTSFELCSVAGGVAFGVENRIARIHIRPDDTSNNNNRRYLDSFGGTLGWNRGSPKTDPLYHSDVAWYGSVLVRNHLAVTLNW
jgi:hypothetical protein